MWVPCFKLYHTLCQLLFGLSDRVFPVVKQESYAIAKMTARYALYMGALKVFECA